MMRIFLFLAPSLALVGLLMTVRARRMPGVTPEIRRLSNASMLFALSVVAGTVPHIVFPSWDGVYVAANVMSFALTIGAFTMVWRARRPTG
jgi:hypothetical protein